MTNCFHEAIFIKFPIKKYFHKKQQKIFKKMNENQNSNKTFRLVGSICSVLSLVLGIICLLISFIPLFGALALYPSIFAFACAVVGLVMAVKAGSSTGASVTALVITILALLFSYMSFVAIQSVVGNTNRYEKSEKTQNQTIALQTEYQEVKEETPETKKNIEESTHKKIEDLGDGWNRFHHKYGFSLELPNNFRATVLANSGLQWYQIDSDFDGFVVTVETMGQGNKKILEESYQTYLQNKNVPYKAIYDDWYVASGYENENIIFYKKAFFKNNQTHFLNITYKTTMKKEVEPLLDRIQKSFR
jgi:hypothetical protein